MKLKLFILTGFLSLNLLAGSAWGAIFIPNPADLNDLDHYKYYTWGINFNLQPNQTIVSANLFIDNINNWQVEDFDKLFIHLLDTSDLGVLDYQDDQGGGDNFTSLFSPNILLDTYTDLQDTPGPTEDYSYNFTPAQLAVLNSYVQNGNFGLGFDPDCHYWNDGVQFTIETSSIPEPASLFLLTSGLLGGLKFRRKRS